MAFVAKLWQRTERFIHRNRPRIIYYRELIRPKILFTAPVQDLLDDTCEVHSLVSSRDFLNLFWSLKSFYYSSNSHYRLCIHDDGSLTEWHASKLRKHFPNATIVMRHEADKVVPPLLVNFPRLASFRRNNPFALRLTDYPVFAKSQQILQLDTDVLFFYRPDYLLSQIESPREIRCFANRDIASAYNIDSQTAREALGIEIIPRLNAGLALLQLSIYAPAWLEEFLSIDCIHSDTWLIEQTLTALSASRAGVDLLPEQYDVDVSNATSTGPCRHYVGQIRHRFYEEGVRRLATGIKRMNGLQ
jgi:hypothetical protein